MYKREGIERERGKENKEKVAEPMPCKPGVAGSIPSFSIKNSK